MFASWFGLRSSRQMNGTTKKSRRRKGRTTLCLEILEDRCVPSTATGTNVGDIAGTIQSQSYLISSPAISPAQSQLSGSPQILSPNVSPNADPITVNWTPSGTALPDATQYVSYSTDISAAPSSGSSTLNVGIDPTSEVQLNNIGLTAVITPASESTPGKLTIQGIPTSFGNFNVTVVAYREPTEPLGTKTYTLHIAEGSSSVISPEITNASVTPNTVNINGSDVNVTAAATVIEATTDPPIPITSGTVTFTLTGASGTILTSSPATLNSSGEATATLTIPSAEPSGDFNLTVNYSGVSALIAPASTTLNNALTVSNTGVSILGSITPTSLTASTVDQSVTANATVKDNNAPVVGGTVTFNLLDSGGTQVTGATATAVTDNSGFASASLPVPANTAAGTYTVTASYTDGSNVVHTATVGTLVINPVEAAATVTLNPIAPITASASDQVVNLSATVTQSGGMGSLGSVQFQVMNGTAVIASTTAAVGSNGVASAPVTIPGGTPAGSYQVVATFTGRGETTATATGTLTINPVPVSPPTPPPPQASFTPFQAALELSIDVAAILLQGNPALANLAVISNVFLGKPLEQGAINLFYDGLAMVNLADGLVDAAVQAGINYADSVLNQTP